MDDTDWPARRFEEHRTGLTAVVYSFTTSGEKITPIDLTADPARLSRLDLVVLGD
jgi:hypothetical protein